MQKVQQIAGEINEDERRKKERNQFEPRIKSVLKNNVKRKLENIMMPKKGYRSCYKIGMNL